MNANLSALFRHRIVNYLLTFTKLRVELMIRTKPEERQFVHISVPPLLLRAYQERVASQGYQTSKTGRQIALIGHL